MEDLATNESNETFVGVINAISNSFGEANFSIVYYEVKVIYLSLITDPKPIAKTKDILSKSIVLNRLSLIVWFIMDLRLIPKLII